MLSKLLRLLILVELLVGAGLGWLLAWGLNLSTTWIVALALLAPFLGVVLSISGSAIQSCPPGGNLALWFKAWWGEMRCAQHAFVLHLPWATSPPEVQPALAPPRVP